MIITKSFIYFNIISFIIAQNEHHLAKFREDNDPVLDPLELVLRSNGTSGIYYCSVRVEGNKQRNKLIVTVEKPVLSLPSFRLKTERINASTIRIRIKPNGYVGFNRIICHRNDNLTYGQTADLIIGENPGVIQLKEQCRAFDRRYVECIFRAPIIARAFLNGFRRLFNFSEVNSESSAYRSPPELVNITHDHELIFHFQPRDRNIIPKKTLMTVNMTLRRIGSSVYYFNIEPLHTTVVDYQIKNISRGQFTIGIHHNITGTISERLCSGQISEVDNQNISKTVQDIRETFDQKIPINGLRSSILYEVCLRCFYEKTDQSFNERKCQRIKTKGWGIWYVLLGIAAALIVLIAIGLLIFYQRRDACGGRKPSAPRSQSVSGSNVTNSNDSEIIDLSDRMKTMEDSSTAQPSTHRYADEPGVGAPLMEHADHPPDEPLAQLYSPMDTVIADLIATNKVSPDTYDLTNHRNTQ